MSEPTIDEGRPPAIESDGSERNDLSLDEICHLLQNGRRRNVLRFLARHEGTAELGEIAEHIAAAENDTTVERLSSDERKRVYIALYQIHVPKLADANVVDYDRDRGTLAARPLVEPLQEALAALQTAPVVTADDAGELLA